MEKMHEKIRNLKRFDPKRNDCAQCKPGRVQCGAPMEKVYNQHDSVFVFICNLCLCLYLYLCPTCVYHMYFKTAKVFLSGAETRSWWERVVSVLGLCVHAEQCILGVTLPPSCFFLKDLVNRMCSNKHLDCEHFH